MSFQFRADVPSNPERRAPVGPLAASFELGRIAFGTAMGLGAAVIDIAMGGVDKPQPITTRTNVPMNPAGQVEPNGFPMAEVPLSQVLERPESS